MFSNFYLLVVNAYRAFNFDSSKYLRISPVTPVSYSTLNTKTMRDRAYWTSGKNSLELIDLSSVENLVQVSSRISTGSKRDTLY